jgi:WD40 repeat protein
VKIAGRKTRTGTDPATSDKNSDPIIGAVEVGRGARLVTWGLSGATYLWKTADGTLVAELQVTTKSEVRSMFDTVGAIEDPNGRRVLTWGFDGTVRAWDIDSGRLCWKLSHEGMITACQYLNDGSTLLTSCVDGMVRLWNVDLIRPGWQHETSGPVSAVNFIRDHKEIMVRGQHGVEIISLASDKPPAVYPHGPDSIVRSARLDANRGHLFTTGRRGRRAGVWVWEAGSKVLLGAPSFDDKSGTAWMAGYASDGQTVLAKVDHDVIQLGRDYFVQKTWDHASLALTKTSALAIVEHSGRTALLDPLSGERLYLFEQKGEVILDDNATLAACLGPRHIEIVPLQTMTPQPIVPAPKATYASFSEDLSYLVTVRRTSAYGGPSQIEVWRRGEAAPVFSVTEAEGVRRIAISVTQELLAVMAGPKCTIWKFSATQPLRIYRHEAGEVYWTLFLPGERVLTAALQSDARLWTLSHNQPLDTFEYTSDYVTMAAPQVTPNGDRLLLCHHQFVDLWSLDPDPAGPNAELKWAIRTATEIDSTGEYRKIPRSEWLKRRLQLDALETE